MADEILQGVLLSRKETKTLKQLKDMGNVKVPVQKKDINYYVVALEEFLQAEAVTFYLDTANGNDSNSGLSRSKPMKTVAAVVALARSMAGGDYFVSKYRLTILGEGETISFNGVSHTNTVLFDTNAFRSDPYVAESDYLPFQVITSEDRATNLIFANSLKITGDALFIGCNGSVTVTNGSSLSASGNVYVKAKNLTLTSAGSIGGGADTIVDVSDTLEMTNGGGISCGGDIVVNAKNIKLLMGCSISNGGSRYFRALRDLTGEYMAYALGASSGITDVEAGNNILIRYVSGSGVSVGSTYPFNMCAGNDITIHTAAGMSDSKENNIVAGGTVRIARTTMPYGANITAKNITDVIDEDISGDIVIGLDVEVLENLKTMTLVAKDTIEVTGLVLKFGIEAAKFICHRLNVAGFINATGSLFIDTDELIINNNLSNISDTSLNLYINAKKATFGGGDNITVNSPRTEGYDEVYIDIGNAPTQGYIHLDGRLNSLVKIDEIKGSFACYLNSQNAVLTQSNRRLLEMSKAYQSYDAVIRVRHRQGTGSTESLAADLKAALESTEVRTIYLVETVFLNEAIVLGRDKVLYGEALTYSGVMTGAFTVKFFNHLEMNSGTFSCAEVYSRTVNGNLTIGGTCTFYYERRLGGTVTVGATASYSYDAWETETYAVADEETITGGAALGTDLKVLNAPVIRQPVFNNTGETISKGTPVALTGTSGERVTISKLISSTTITEQVNVGIVDADILPNMEGYAVRSGEITMDTSAWEEGDTLYASTTAGVLSTSRPAKGYGLIPVGIVIKKDGVDAGKVLVNPSSVPRISQLPDVNLVDPVPNQVLSIDDDGLVENRFITFIATYNSTENAAIDEEFEKGSIIVCYRGYAYAEYLPLIRRIAKTSHPDPDTYIYVFGAVHDGNVVEITCDPVDGWSVEETPVGGNYQLKGPWSSGVDYVMNDFCTFGGNLYICTNGYTSGPLYDGPSIDTAHWELFFSGSSSTYQLKGEWEVGVDYVVNDFCTFGDNLYICKSAYTSDPLSDNPSIDADHWDLFFSGSSSTYQLKDNAYDSVTDPINSDNITDIEQLTFIRNVGVDANYTMVESEKRIYGVLIPAPSLQADHGKVPMLNSLGQIIWETVPSPESVSAEIADAVATVKTNNIFTIPLGSIQKVIAPEGAGTLYSYWTIISPSMDFPLSEKTTLSFLIKQLGACTKAYLAIYEIDIYNQKKKWVANTNDFHASLSLGYNYVNLAYINSSAKLSSDKLYYICLISNINSFQFAGNSYDTQFNGVPRLANKIDNVNAEFNAATMQTVYAEFGLTEGSEILDRLFFNISNVERIVDPVAPTPFVALTNITLGHTKNVGNLVPAATTFGDNGILYQKVIPQMDITIKSVWVLDYHSSQNAALLSLFILDEDLNSITSVNVPTLTNAGTSEKIGDYYVHKYAFSTPITLQEGKGYWMPAIGNCSAGTSEWAIQYTAADPSIPIRDMLAVSDITNFAIADKVIANNKNGCYLKLIDTTDTEWQI